MTIQPNHSHTVKNILNPDVKKEQLVKFANSVMNDPSHAKEFSFILSELRLTKGKIIKSFLEYNLDIYDASGNSIYESLANRVVLHIHNLLAGSWHIERQKTIEDFIKLSNPTTAADIGFGVPSRYVKNLVINDNRFELTLCDLYESAFIFARTLLKLWDNDGGSGKVKFLKTDMDNNEFVGNFDLYIFQDSIEHTHYPASYLKKYVKLSPSNAKFLISLPIGPIIPRHFIAWETEKEGVEWLKKCGLKVDSSKVIFVNPKVDLFAEQISLRYCNLMVLCSKIE